MNDRNDAVQTADRPPGHRHSVRTSTTTLTLGLPRCKSGSVLALMVQAGGSRFYPGGINLLDPVILIVFVVCVGGLALLSLELIVSRSRRAMRTRRIERRRRNAAINAEMRARALMSELCPHGWTAHITLLGTYDGHEVDAEDLLDGQDATQTTAKVAGVAIDWAELEAGTGRAVVTRRVSAPTIGEALEAMVADRRTDETLEQIEQGAVADGALWPDL